MAYKKKLVQLINGVFNMWVSRDSDFVYFMNIAFMGSM